ncbi:M20/M25/M40 family metallo-hydrolase [Roseicyclus mahoneyensis]|uniref:Acetylornithine deacetylase/succinyl-diaminopimelate desuccinylase-like protein n=1 Tax=Roseicyclus mahoneyensis TaxID=164332 RepID=A0A316GQH2_9RHOB|nr:M20/M25/M40 family metallo-hydrolase [Roseicyclus mahoneyensis]PWK62651.1 acetylornithine deacetylase/succinyl-diaminopimelate desuccinylase-like protein [Roseicyclus mahoneyensis]
MSLDAILARLDADLDAATARLFELLRIPSISTDPAFATDVRRAAEWLRDDLATIGFDAQVHDTPGHPMVMGQIDGPGPHLLFYGHYDVQPVDPLSLWDRDPFDPALQDTPKGKVIRARGAADDKGQLMTFLEACRAIKAETGRLPCKITVFFEGEEESGSPSLVPYLKAHGDALKADLALICDTGLFTDDVPAIVTQLRGMLGEEMTITGPRIDLHSGMYGGMAMNPIRVLTRILGGLHDDQGRVQVPGFYDDVAEISDDLRTQWQTLDFDANAFLGEVGQSQPAGEAGRMPLEMLWSRPTAEINGIWGGYTGAGFKTVLPAQAHAKVSFRLVAAQDPLKLRAAFRAWVEAQLPTDCTVTWTAHGASPASRMDIGHPAFEIARKALSLEWPGEAAFIGGGGSIPVAGHFKEILGMDSLLAGFGKDDDAIHSPNEKYDLSSFHRGQRAWARILTGIAEG